MSVKTSAAVASRMVLATLLATASWSLGACASDSGGGAVLTRTDAGSGSTADGGAVEPDDATSTPSDPGIGSADEGEADAGEAPAPDQGASADSGEASDAGPAPTDPGSAVDAGPAPADHGEASDAGPSPVDQGEASDAGPAPTDPGASDAGSPPVDSGGSQPCPGGCYEDGDCPEELRCVGGDTDEELSGVCLPPYDAPKCWSDEDCPSRAECEGATHCPPCVDCAALQAPGTCKPRSGERPGMLWIEPRPFYDSGADLAPIWFNLGDEPIYFAGCTTYVVERQDPETGVWENKGPPAVCVWEGFARKVEPGTTQAAMTTRAPPEGLAGGFATYRMHGLYWTGCQDDPPEPISGAECTGGPFDAFTDELLVGSPF